MELSVRVGTLCAALSLGLVPIGCTDGPDAPPIRSDDGRGAAAGANFTFAVADDHADGAFPESFTTERLEAFFGDALAPLQALPGLLPRTVSVVYEPCGEPNAFHDRASDSIRICRELADHARGLFELLEPPFPDDPQANDTALDAYVLSALGFVLYHEIAHALDFQRALPLVGNVESAMDSIATVIAAETGRFAFPLAGTTLFLRESGSLAGQHGGGPGRVEDIECWASGGEAVVGARAGGAAAPVAGATPVAGAAGRDCAGRYSQLLDAVRSWVPELASLTLGASDPVALPPPGGRALLLRPGEAWLAGAGSDPDARRRVERLFTEAFGSLEAVARGLLGPVDVVYDECGAATSSYDPSTRTVRLCAEIVERAYDLQLGWYRSDFGREPNAADRRILRELAHGFLRFTLHHEIGHAVQATGRVPTGEDVETVADIVAAVLLVEAGRGWDVDSAARFVARWPEEEELHGDRFAREATLQCLALGGDAAVRADPNVGTGLIETYVAGDRDCIGEYAARRDQVRAWTAPESSDP